MLHSSKSSRRTLSDRLNDPGASEITNAELRVLWTFDALTEESPNGNSPPGGGGGEIGIAIVTTEAYVSAGQVRGMASLN
ncbi:MAG: hypothetical protein AAB855_01135 [Patescibacteria group bacterium]